ncbi:MAG: helix-turn-helix transcriptional regulator [Anaerolineales bacterium]|nr:helix-turn-helix transcriptional regulator [Anaerolineales bacterium]QYK51808.1 MAG: helix-turn-helix transcriptional regulator [Anaerolineales bacterium]
MEALAFPAWLEQKYLEWQGQRGKRATLAQFAEHLGISAPLLSHYLNGLRKPTAENVGKLAQRLGPEIYEILGLQDPDPKLRFIARNWGRLTSEQQQQLLASAETMLKAGHEKPKARRARQSKRTKE